MPQKTHMTSLRLPVELKQQLDKVAAFRDRKPHWIMIKAIENYLEQENEEIIWFQQRVQAMEEDKAEGKLIAADDVFSRLEERIAQAQANERS